MRHKEHHASLLYQQYIREAIQIALAKYQCLTHDWKNTRRKVMVRI